MANNSCNLLEVKHIVEAAKESIQYLDKRRKGEIPVLKTPWSKYNKLSGGGLEWHMIHSFCGSSGSGKSALANQLEDALFDLNPEVEFDILNFSFEMLSRNQVTRKLSRLHSKSVRELQSGTEEVTIGDEEFETIKAFARTLIKKNIFYIETAGTSDEIVNTILHFYKAKQIEHNDPERGLVVFLDHTVLTKGKNTDKERDILVDLFEKFIVLKKIIKVCIIPLSQLNRNIESTDRLSDPSQQYPKKSDVFASESLYQASDFVTIIMNPFHLGLETYGPNHLPTEGFIYAHCLKNRDGDSGIIQMINKLKWNIIEEYSENGY